MSAVLSPCHRCQSPIERGDLRCAICGLPTPSTPQGGDVAVEAIASILRCNGCGAAVAYDAKVGAPKCGFCGSVMEVETPEDPIEEAQSFLVFRVDAEQAKTSLRQWMGTLGFFRPRDLSSRSTVDSLKPLWWAGWCFDADVVVTWAADSNAGSGRSDWAPHSGKMSVSLQHVVVSASRGLQDGEIAQLVPGYNLADAGPEPHEHPGATVEQFAVQRSAARQTIAAALGSQAARLASAQVPGSSQRNLHVSVLPERMVTHRLAFPAYVLAYRYDGKLYRAIVHGQNPGLVIGKAPIAWGRIAAIAAAALVAVVVIALVIAALN
jgi:hypothetical protein